MSERPDFPRWSVTDATMLFFLLTAICVVFFRMASCAEGCDEVEKAHVGAREANALETLRLENETRLKTLQFQAEAERARADIARANADALNTLQRVADRYRGAADAGQLAADAGTRAPRFFYDPTLDGTLVLPMGK